MGNGFDLYLVQSPAVVDKQFYDKGYNNDLLEHYDGSVAVKNIYEFVVRAQFEVAMREKYIRKLVIGAHGAGSWSGGGFFYIGSNVVTSSDTEYFKILSGLAPLFTKDASVYIMACQTGYNEDLLKKLSQAWGGIPVYGYTGLITTSDYWLWISVDKGGDEVVCVPSSCNGGSNRLIPGSK